METLEDLLSNDKIRDEYKKTFLLNLFKKLCVKMNRDETFKMKIRTLYRQTHDKSLTTQVIIQKIFEFEIGKEDAQKVSKWIDAYLKKGSKRRTISKELKEELCKKQNWKCMVCGEDLDKDGSRIHVDHIIPWSLVGDELENNYQVLCETCNESKSASIDYLFKNLLNLG